MTEQISCFVCKKSRPTKFKYIYDIQVPVHKNEMISYFEAMKQLTGIEVSAMLLFITLTAIGFLRIFKSHFRDLRLDVLVAIFF